MAKSSLAGRVKVVEQSALFPDRRVLEVTCRPFVDTLLFALCPVRSVSFAARYLGRLEPSGFSQRMLETFLESAVEEGLNLDYKDIEAAGNPDKLATVISAFANAEGGLLILGVSEKEELDERGHVVRIRPGTITWGAKSLAREKIESMLVSRIRPWVNGLRIHAIRNDANEAVFLIDVPQSMRPPHQASDRRYHLRYNFQNLPMDHHQVEDLFFRRLRPVIRPQLEVMNFEKDTSTITMRIGLANQGSVIGKHVLFFGEFLSCKSVKSKDDRWFLSVDPIAGRERCFQVSFHSPIVVVHPRMVSYAGRIDIVLSGPLMISFLIGAEDAPTVRFLSGVSLQYLAGLDRDFQEEPLTLVATSPEEEYDQDAQDGLFRQLGIDPEEFRKAMQKVVDSEDPESLKRAIAEFEEFAAKYG